MPKKEEPRRGECQGSYALHRTHYIPRLKTQLGSYSMPMDLWQFFDGSLSVFLIATSICGRAFTPRGASRTPDREVQRRTGRRVPAHGRKPCLAARPMHNG